MEPSALSVPGLVSATDATLILGLALLVVIILLALIAKSARPDPAKTIVAIAAVLAGVFGGGALGTIFVKDVADTTIEAAEKAAEKTGEVTDAVGEVQKEVGEVQKEVGEVRDAVANGNEQSGRGS